MLILPNASILLLTRFSNALVTDVAIQRNRLSRAIGLVLLQCGITKARTFVDIRLGSGGANNRRAGFGKRDGDCSANTAPCAGDYSYLAA